MGRRRNLSSLDIYHSYIYFSHHSLSHITETPALDLPPLLVHRQHRILCSLEPSNTRPAGQILTERTSGMEESTRSCDNRAARPPQPPKVVKKISTADAGFLNWLKEQEPAVEWDEGKKKRYLAILNARRKEAYEQKLKDYQSKVNQSMGEPLAPEQTSPITATPINSNPSQATTQTSQ